jgi:hypothetical protein
MKKIVAILLSCLSLSSYACNDAADTSSSNFCPTFRSSVYCYCTDVWKMPGTLCQDMNRVYSMMVDTHGSLERACEFQKNTPKQRCIDNWNCYHNGGRDSHGALCSSTGRSCG